MNGVIQYFSGDVAEPLLKGVAPSSESSTKIIMRGKHGFANQARIPTYSLHPLHFGRYSKTSRVTLTVISFLRQVLK